MSRPTSPQQVSPPLHHSVPAQHPGTEEPDVAEPELRLWTGSTAAVALASAALVRRIRAAASLGAERGGTGR